MLPTRFEVPLRRRLCGEIEDRSDDERADRDVRQRRMQRMSEPRPMQKIAEPREGSIDRAEDALHKIAERVGPHGLRVQQRLEPAAEHAQRFCTMRTTPGRSAAAQASCLARRCQRTVIELAPAVTRTVTRAVAVP